MKAMVFAAGLGSRLRPLTDDRPKALVEIGGRSLLDLTLARLRTYGVHEAVVNAHHFADAIAAHLATHGNFGMRIELSREEVLLDTGGGLRKAAGFFLESPDEPFIVHNVDVLSTMDLGRMAVCHAASGALATLAVRNRKTSRALLFDESGQLRGRASGGAVPEGRAPFAFSGMHIASPRVGGLLRKNYPADRPFSIIDAYLALARRGERILGHRDDTSYWRDLGRIEDLEKAREEWAC
jgi:NDP-sugar pyrophosphorylase family protein